ncbi:MAG: hypothetical protein ACTSP4_11865 [Candidatus Hodarchaeales archaeon]
MAEIWNLYEPINKAESKEAVKQRVKELKEAEKDLNYLKDYKLLLFSQFDLTSF